MANENFYWVRCERVGRPIPFAVTVHYSQSPNARIVEYIDLKPGAIAHFDRDDANTTSEMVGFTIQVNPAASSDDIEVLPADSSHPGRVSVINHGAHGPVDNGVDLHLKAKKGGTGYEVDSGKPTIRNRPQLTQGIKLVLYAVGLLAAVAAIWLVGHVMLELF